MKIKDYLKAKYPKGYFGLTYQEAKVFGEKWPLESGWVKRISEKEITEVMQQDLINRLLLATREKSTAGLEVFGVARPSNKELKQTRKQQRKERLSRKQSKKVAFVELCEKIGFEEAKKQQQTQEKKKHKVVTTYGNVASTDFLQTYEWRKLRMEALKKYGPVCQCCGASRETGAVINVDHIKPRKLFPQLALDINNLQILCHECNHGKGNWDMTDWRNLDDNQKEHLKSI